MAEEQTSAMRRCSKCGETKPTTEFSVKDRKGRLSRQCKACRNEHARIRGKTAAWKQKRREQRARYMAKPGAREKEYAYARRWRRSNWAAAMCHSARTRARDLNVPFELTPADVEKLRVFWCPVFRVRMRYADSKPLQTHQKKGLCPNSASLDRVIPKLGYVRGNVRIISFRANTLKSDGTLDEIIALGRWAERERRRGLASRHPPPPWIAKTIA